MFFTLGMMLLAYVHYLPIQHIGPDKEILSICVKF